MLQVGQLPRRTREVEHFWITLADGCRLSARLWLPVDAEDQPVPAILEYLPYRKRDGTALRDETVHPYLAGHGYACLRVDIRGNGESDGLMDDEYTAQELADGKEVIEWIAAQPWCTGRVGMIGISWGGFNALQVAALRPAPLKAIVTICSTDDRYADDIHYMGGCLLNDNLTWSSQMLAYSSRAPDPALVGEDWREIWLARLEAMPLLATKWLGHQRRDAYWEHGSVCEDYGAIEAAVLAVGGWADAYSNAIPRLLKGLPGPALGLIGPWVHKYPHMAHPEPAIGFLQEILRWWDHWLKGEQTGIMSEPRLRVYVMESMRPAVDYAARAGRWIGAESWPPAGAETRVLHLTPDGLSDAPGADAELVIHSPLTTGSNCGSFCAGMRVGHEHPGDQRPDDAGSLCFDTPPLEAPLEILGAPLVELCLASDRPVAQVTARLCDLHPDGASTRISFAPLNLTHRDSHETPSPLTPGEFVDLRLALNDIAYVVPAGHRIRLAVSSAYWPMIWPAPEIASLRLRTGPCRLHLPVGPNQNDGAVSFEAPEGSPELAREILRAEVCSRRLDQDLADGTVALSTTDDFGKARISSHGLEVGSEVRQDFSIRPDDPLSARSRACWTYSLGRGDWQTRTESETTMWSDETTFYLAARLRGFVADQQVFERTWSEAIPRDLL